MSDINDLVPVSPEEFANEVTPCLSLASGVGMSRQDQRVWLNAAYRALDGIPIALLKRGCDTAMKTADHPSKIVPAIIGAVQSDWDWRKSHRRPLTIMNDVAERGEVAPEERAKVAQTMGQLLAKMQANTPDLDTVLGRKA